MSTTKFIGAFITKVKDRDERIIYARASQDTLDRDGEIIRLSAWKDAQLNEFLERSGALLVSHNYAKLPVGRILRFDKRTDGLYFEAQLIKGTEAADEAWAVISQTGKCGFSVGFRPNEFTNIPVRMLEDRERESALKAGLSSGDSVLVYTDVELLEISLVSVPALPTATLIAYKAGALTDGMLCKACKEIDIEIEDDDPEVEIEPDPEVVLRRELSAIDAEREAIKRARASHKADDEAANIHRICMAMIREYMGSSRF